MNPVRSSIPSRVFHGSFRFFVNFSADEIGTGLKGETHGRGLYFTECPKLAATYAGEVSELHSGTGPLVYSVSLNLSGEDLLDRHLRLEEQTAVFAKLGNAGLLKYLDKSPNYKATGFCVLFALKKLSAETEWGPKFGQHTSDLLLQAGIKGVSFAERDEKTGRLLRGYCIFDPSCVSVCSVQRADLVLAC